MGSKQVYCFNERLECGEVYERFLDEFFSDRFDIYPATRRQQRQGIDRIFVNRKTGKVLKVEYKTDFQAHRTGNAFLEVDTANKKGWVYTSKADYLLYFVVEDLLIYAIPFATLRKVFPAWLKRYETRKVASEGYFEHYFTQGVLVPLAELERHAEAAISA